MDHVLPETALKLREAGFPQGGTEYLWHKQKGAKISFPKHGIVAGEEHWHLYKRNKHDISAFGDSHGYNRWVSAPTIDQANRWASFMDRQEDIIKNLEDTIEKAVADPLIEFLKNIKERMDKDER